MQNALVLIKFSQIIFSGIVWRSEWTICMRKVYNIALPTPWKRCQSIAGLPREAPLLKRLDSAIHHVHRINHYLNKGVVGKLIVLPLDRNLSSGWCYSPLEQLDPVPRKIVKFNPGLSQISSAVLSSKYTQLEVAKCCWAFTTRYRNDDTKCYPKQCIGM